MFAFRPPSALSTKVCLATERRFLSSIYKPKPHKFKMGKKKSGPSTPPSSYLLLPTPPTSKPIVDTHTHLAATFQMYQSRYATRSADVNDLPTSQGKTIKTVYDFTKVMYEGRGVEAIVDVWCETTQIKNRLWKEFADAALEGESKWGGMQYWFVIGIHPHEAKDYNDEIERIILEAAAHPRCVGLGEMGLDYHYSLSPHPIQQSIFRKQLQHAVRLNKPLTIHTREAEDDTERILKEEVPRGHKIHIHCFTDTPAFAKRLLDWFPNLYIGVTGVVTYSTNTNTSEVVKNLARLSPSSSGGLRILLETDAPYMVPSNIYDAIPAIKGKRLPVCHTAMVPWTAQFVADAIGNPEVASEGAGESGGGSNVNVWQPQEALWTADRIMAEARENAKTVYGV